MIRRPLPPGSLSPSLILSLALLPLGLLAGCADDAAPTHRQVLVEIPDDPALAPPTYDEDGNPLPPQVDPLPDAQGDHYILIVDGDDEIEVPLGGEAELRVLLFNTLGEPVEGLQVEFTIEDAPPGAPGQLSSRRAVTGRDGAASVDFVAPDTVGTHTVRVRGPAPRPALFTIDVVDLPTGSVRISFEPDGLVAIGNIELYLIPDTGWCEDPYYLAPPMEPFETRNVEWVGDTVDVGPLLAGTRFAVVARGRTVDDHMLAAGGCVGDLRIRDGERVDVQVVLNTLPLNPAGVYQVDNNLDFTDAIPGTLGDVIRALVQFFGDQHHEREIASLIFDQVERLARDAAGAIGALIVDLVRGWVEDDLNEIINDYIDQDAPQWVRDFFTIGSDLISVVSSTEVISHIRLNKPRRDGTFLGSQNWVGMAFYWRLPCDGNPDPECGRHAFTMDDLADGSSGIELVFGQFEGRVHSRDQGVIYSHTLDLQYGRLILFVLNNLILPEIAGGAHNITDALVNLANCPAFADGITGGRDHLRLGGINIVSRDTIEGWCSGIMNVVGDTASAILGRLRIDTRMTLEGEMTFVEEDDDLVVDRIIDGRWTGIIRTNEDEGPPFEGWFEGARITSD
ncbi:MAG: hypothetical protein H6701_06605 [Myxococcales bacterium]|nr:hypothetical protein [Myxococcales bacterium]